MDDHLLQHAEEIVAAVSNATAGATNEATLRYELERILERHCRALGLPWTPFQLEHRLVAEPGGQVRFADVVHGAVVIEYESPRSFSGREGAKLRAAQAQAATYARLLHQEEGRDLSEYVLVAWDGAHICFGRFEGEGTRWSSLVAFDRSAAHRLLRYIEEDGRPLVHPRLLQQLVGPESSVGARLIPRFFTAIRQAATRPEGRTNKTRLLFVEWKRLFGQIVGLQSERLKGLLRRQEQAHRQPYSAAPIMYLFALNTYIALVAKLVAALSLPHASQNIADSAVPVRERIRALESGHLFQDAGISNMLIGDLFSWYGDDAHWPTFEAAIEELITDLGDINFDVTRQAPHTTRDLFKGIYQTFVPRELRHTLGEYYTPDWLAAHALDAIGWQPEDALLDPTCGTGTFILEALRRRLTEHPHRNEARALLSGLYGIDLNPLAVLAARASLVVFLSRYLNPAAPVRLPIFLADAINTASLRDGVFWHTMPTELGPKSFGIPQSLVEDERFYDVMMRVRELMEADLEPEPLNAAIHAEFRLDYLSQRERAALLDTITALVEMHR